MNAMEKEMESLHKNDVWELVELPKDRKAVGSGYFNSKPMLMGLSNVTRPDLLLKVSLKNMVWIMMKHSHQ